MCDFDKPDKDIYIPPSTSEVSESNKKTYDESNWQELMDDAIDFASTISDTYSDKAEMNSVMKKVRHIRQELNILTEMTTMKRRMSHEKETIDTDSICVRFVAVIRL